MGNLFSNGNEWRISSDNGNCSPDRPLRVKAYYNARESQVVIISGPLPLNCTLEIDNATIEINGDRHHICIIGSNNNITVRGANNVLRAEGLGNRIDGVGAGTIVYTNNVVSYLNNVEAKLLRNEAGQMVDDAPALLPLMDDPVERSNDCAAQAMIRFSYTTRASGGDDKTSANGAAGDAPQNMDTDPPSPDDPPSDENDASGKRSQEDVKDDPESKRLKAD